MKKEWKNKSPADVNRWIQTAAGMSDVRDKDGKPLRVSKPKKKKEGK